jgi:hypothetical protein
MQCPLCARRKARRSCPALGRTICALCCGTKRLTEIRCPDDCPHLASAREHPAAEVRRRQEADAAVILPALRGLTERQQQLFFVFQSVATRHQPGELLRLVDDDVAQAAAACAATLESAEKGVVYEHQPAAAPAQRLAAELTAMLVKLREQGPTIYDHEAARALRAIEQAARDAGRTRPGDRAYLELMARVLQQNGPQTAADAPRDTGGAIVVP